MVKKLPVMQETLGWEDPLEKVLATHSSILAWRIPWTEKPGRPSSMGSQESDTTATKPPPMLIWASHVALVVKNLPANTGDIRDVGLIPG